MKINYQTISLTKIVRYVIQKEKVILYFTASLICVIFITLTILTKMIQVNLWQIAQQTQNLKHLTDQNLKTATTVITLKTKLEITEKKLIIDKRERYYNNLAVKIEGYYNGMGNFRSKAHYLIGIRAAFFASERLFEKKEVKYYTKTSKECALKLLATAKNETNFVYDDWEWNFKRDKKGMYETVWGYKVKDKEKFKDYLIKTSKDFGWLRCNECNINWTLKKLKQLGLWHEKEGRWLLDLEVNALMRILIDDYRIKMKWNTPDNCNFNQNFYKMLLKVDYEQ